MGHRRLSTTLIYTRIHNHTVAEDYYAAMAQVERVYQDIDVKRRTTRPLHLKPLLIEPIDEIS